MFEHRQSVAPLFSRDATGSNLWFGLTAVTLLVAALLWQLSPWLSVFVVALFAVVSFVLLLRYLAADVPPSGEFVCRIDHESIECICPDKREGESFQLRLIEIVELRRMPADDSHGWYVVDVYGRRYWLTNHYGNPADLFAKLIENGNLSVDLYE